MSLFVAYGIHCFFVFLCLHLFPFFSLFFPFLFLWKRVVDVVAKVARVGVCVCVCGVGEQPYKRVLQAA